MTCQSKNETFQLNTFSFFIKQIILLCINQFHHSKQKSNQEPNKKMSLWKTVRFVLLIVLACTFSFVAVLLERGCGLQFLLNLGLWCLFFLPGIIHALILILNGEKHNL